MKKSYKILFWISFILLIFTNSYWLYNAIDNAVGHNYYQVSCEEWQKDNKELKKLLPTETGYLSTLSQLNDNGIAFDEFQKGDNKIIQFSSFDLVFDKNGKLKEFNER